MKYTSVREDHTITVMKSKGLPDELANAIGTIARYCIFWEIEHDPEMKQFKLNARFVSSPQHTGGWRKLRTENTSTPLGQS